MPQARNNDIPFNHVGRLRRPRVHPQYIHVPRAEVRRPANPAPIRRSWSILKVIFYLTVSMVLLNKLYAREIKQAVREIGSAPVRSIHMSLVPSKTATEEAAGANESATTPAAAPSLVSHVLEISPQNENPPSRLRNETPEHDEDEPSRAAEPAPAPREVPDATPDNPQVKGPELASLVAERLSSDRRLRRVRAEINGCAVNLSGEVYNDRMKQVAERAAAVEGACSVSDNVATEVDREHEQEQEITRILQQGGLGRVTVSVIEHDCYLHGEVPSEAQKELAVRLAESQGVSCPAEYNFILVRPQSFGLFAEN